MFGECLIVASPIHQVSIPCLHSRLMLTHHFLSSEARQMFVRIFELWASWRVLTVFRICVCGCGWMLQKSVEKTNLKKQDEAMLHYSESFEVQDKLIFSFKTFS